MNERLIWLAPIALATLLSGCSISVTTTGPIAPNSLVGYTLTFMHDKQEGALPADSHRFHFKSLQRALDAKLDPVQDWTYKPKTGGIATLSVTVAESASVAVRVTCELAFDSKYEGEHECEYVQSASIAFIEIISRSSSEGTFDIRKIGSDVP